MSDGEAPSNKAPRQSQGRLRPAVWSAPAGAAPVAPDGSERGSDDSDASVGAGGTRASTTGDAHDDDDLDWDGSASEQSGRAKRAESDPANALASCNDIVDAYAHDRIDKLEAISALCKALDGVGEPKSVDPWLDMLTRADRAKERAARVGAGDVAPAVQGGARRAGVDAGVRQPHFLGPTMPKRAAGPSKRLAAPVFAADPDDSTVASDDSDDDDNALGRAGSSSRDQRPSFDISKTVFGRQDSAAQPVREVVRQTIDMRNNYGLNIAAVKYFISSDPRAPPFPPDLWEDVIRDRVVDFDKILTARYPAEVQERASHTIGGSDGPVLVFGTRAKRSVSSRNDWTECYDTYEAFLTYLYPHRANECRVYKRLVLGLFGSRSPAFHTSVIRADITMRSEVALRNDLALDDAMDLMWVWQRWVDARGVYADDIQPVAEPSKSARKHKTKPVAASSGQFCNKWNDGRCTFPACRHLHACRICNSREHAACNHPVT